MTGQETLIVISFIAFCLLLLFKVWHVSRGLNQLDPIWMWMTLAGGTICNGVIFILSMADVDDFFNIQIRLISGPMFTLFIFLFVAEFLLFLGRTGTGRFSSNGRH